MRTIFLSFKDKWYEYLRSGQKIYEHRGRFCKGSVIAYLYVGIPRQEVVAIMELGERVELASWLDKYKDDADCIDRIKESMQRNKYVMEIKRIQFIKPIKVSDIKEKFPDFHIPISYFYIDKKPELLKYLEENTVCDSDLIVHSFDAITSDDICRY